MSYAHDAENVLEKYAGDDGKIIGSMVYFYSGGMTDNEQNNISFRISETAGIIAADRIKV